MRAAVAALCVSLTLACQQPERKAPTQPFPPVEISCADYELVLVPSFDWSEVRGLPLATCGASKVEKCSEAWHPSPQLALILNGVGQVTVLPGGRSESSRDIGVDPAADWESQIRAFLDFRRSIAGGSRVPIVLASADPVSDFAEDGHAIAQEVLKLLEQEGTWIEVQVPIQP